MSVGERPLRVVAIDDSRAVRHWVKEVLTKAGISVVAEAGDGRAGRDAIVAHDPDVVVTDLNMPDVDGITLLKAITRHDPRPIIVLSSTTAPGSVAALTALEAGATHVLAKPNGPGESAALGAELVRRVKQAARAQVRYQVGAPPVRASSAELRPTNYRFAPRQLVAIGSSTGGPGALRVLLSGIPQNCPPIVIAQHTPPSHASQLAPRLAQETGLDVQFATAGEVLRAGMVRIAPPGVHLLVAWSADGFVTQLGNGVPEHYQRPAVDVLFRAVAGAAKHAAVGVLLTGMGEDGAAGLLAMRTAGATTIAQDEATSVVYGMPRAAVERGAASAVLGLERIAPAIVHALKRLPEPVRAA